MILTTSKLCDGCKWNKFPYCDGMIDQFGSKMRIDRLNEQFRCGQKDKDIVYIETVNKSELELLQEEVEELKTRLTIIEKK